MDIDTNMWVDINDNIRDGAMERIIRFAEFLSHESLVLSKIERRTMARLIQKALDEYNKNLNKE